MKKVEMFKVNVDEKKFDEIVPLNAEMEITKDDIKNAFLPIFDSMGDYSHGVTKRMKTYELVQSFVETNSDVLSEQMHQTFLKHKTGVSLVLGVAIPSNPYMPYKITKCFTMPNNEPNMFEVVAIDFNKNKPITLGTFTYVNCFTEKEYKEIMSQIGQMCEMEK